MSNRRTDADTFALGMWAASAVNELTTLIEHYSEHYSSAETSDAVPPLTALQSLIRNAKDTGDLATLDKLRGYWKITE